ncbi:MAG: hypothetical protein GWP19_01840 [Planctomycetia bacterium]|nr:hypothetical protein [Planctomycetia bacterium]
MTISNIIIPVQTIPPQVIVSETAGTTPILINELKRICACESTWNPISEPQHFNIDGSVLRGEVNPSDIGQCQINTKYWGELADELGYDLFDKDDNIRMAQYIYDIKGNAPWYLSKKCWNNFPVVQLAE